MLSLLCISILCLMGTSFPGYSFAEEPKAVYVYDDASVSGSQLTFNYKPESLYEVDCMPGHITDISLKPGEKITAIVAGDTAQWFIDQCTVNNITHVYVKPIRDGLKTNLIINSSYHSYRLLLRSVDSYNAIVSWNFDEEARLSLQNRLSREQNLTLPQKHRLNFDYELNPKKSSLAYLTPIAVFDDGIHTYVKMPNEARYDLPVLYLVDGNNKLSIVNYRVKKNLFIADRLFTHGRLLFAKDLSIDFYAKQKKAGA